MNSPSTITHEEISQRAHDIWEQSGRLDGQETEHWLRAERELQNERRQAQRLEKGSPVQKSNNRSAPKADEARSTFRR